MSTELALPQHQITSYSAFTPSQLEVMRENLDGQAISFFDLTVVKCPAGGGKFFEIDTPAGSVSAATITGIMPFTTLHGTLWPSLEDRNGSKPILVTRDMKTGRLAAPDTAVRGDDGRLTDLGNPSASAEMLKTLAELEDLNTHTWDWPSLPYSQFGTGRDGQGKFAKEGRLCFVCTKDSALPICVRLPASSLKGMKSILLKLTLPYYHYVWEFSLVQKESKGPKKEKYSEIVPRIVGQITPEEATVVAANWKAPLETEWRRADASRVAEAADVTES